MSTMTRTGTVAALAAVLAALAAGAATARAQQAPPKKTTTGQTIEIRGQAPTPQVVTVRPREVPVYKAAALPGAVMASGAWPSVTAGYAITPSNQLAGRLPIDTSSAGLARGGAMLGGVAVAGAASGAAAAGAGAPGAATPGGSAAEIEAMRQELKMRRARLDSLERALHENGARQSALGAPPPGGAPRSSATDAAARAAEIDAIRRELNYRMQRLDSLQREVNTLGRAKTLPPVKSDTTKKAPPASKPPRGSR